MSKRYGTVMERIERDTFYEPNCGCWLFAGPWDDNGYGRIRIGKNKVRVHKFTFEQDNEPLLEGQVVRHLCDMRACWNPDHLLPGTHVDNVADMDKRGRRSLRHSEVLSEEQVKAIRLEEGSFRAISRKYGVAHNTISKIKRGVSWQYLS
jgi:hypothetical protein